MSFNVPQWQMRMGITKHNLAATTERLVKASSGQIKLDGVVFKKNLCGKKKNGVVFLNLTVADATSSQLVYVMPQVTCLFLSQSSYN